ncbi:hypothetical protein BGZ65_004412, partial [Modicella reniformis]
LQCVRYKWLPTEVLPPRITSTAGGVDFYLTNIRRVVKTLSKLWRCKPEEIKILSLDLGQTYVAPHNRDDEEPSTAPVPLTFYNLAVKQKAIYQPTFKHRRWLEGEKSKDSRDGMRSVKDIESELPPLRGEGASSSTYPDKHGAVKEQLNEFYNHNNRHKEAHVRLNKG